MIISIAIDLSIDKHMYLLQNRLIPIFQLYPKQVSSTIGVEIGVTLAPDIQ